MWHWEAVVPETCGAWEEHTELRKEATKLQGGRVGVRGRPRVLGSRVTVGTQSCSGCSNRCRPKLAPASGSQAGVADLGMVASACSLTQVEVTQ